MAQTDDPAATCTTCAATLPPESRFCPSCGSRRVVGETLEMVPDPVVPRPPSEVPPAQSAPTIHQVHRRPLGIHPAPLLGGVGSGVLLAAIILFAVSSWIAGLIFLGLALALLTLFVSAVKREPDTATARLVLIAANRARSRSRLAAVTTRTWSDAGLRLIGIRRRQHHLRGQLQQRLKPLGEAVYREDQTQAEALKQQAAELERELKGTEHEAAEVLGAARDEIDRERATVEPTQTLTAAEKAPDKNASHPPAGETSNLESQKNNARSSPLPPTTPNRKDAR